MSKPVDDYVQTLIKSLRTMKASKPELDFTVGSDADHIIINNVLITSDDIARWHKRIFNIGRPYVELNTSESYLRLGTTLINLYPSANRCPELPTAIISSHRGPVPKSFDQSKITDTSTRNLYKTRWRQLFTILKQFKVGSVNEQLFKAYCLLLGYSLDINSISTTTPVYVGPNSGLVAINDPLTRYAMLVEFIVRYNERFNSDDLNLFIEECHKTFTVNRLTHSPRSNGNLHIDMVEDHVFRIFTVEQGKVRNLLTWKQHINGHTLKREDK